MLFLPHSLIPFTDATAYLRTHFLAALAYMPVHIQYILTIISALLGIKNNL